jgi:hypothetical protein
MAARERLADYGGADGRTRLQAAIARALPRRGGGARGQRDRDHQSQAAEWEAHASPMRRGQCGLHGQRLLIRETDSKSVFIYAEISLLA